MTNPRLSRFSRSIAGRVAVVAQPFRFLHRKRDQTRIGFEHLGYGRDRLLDGDLRESRCGAGVGLIRWRRRRPRACRCTGVSVRRR